MPSHKVHAYVDRMCFGKVYWKVHRLMDSAYQYFRGKHRIFWHNPISAYVIAAKSYPGDENAAFSALLHIQVDDMCSSDPFLDSQLWLLAKEDAEKRKQSKKRKTKPRQKEVTNSPEIEKTENFFKKLTELEKLIERARFLLLKIIRAAKAPVLYNSFYGKRMMHSISARACLVLHGCF